MTPISNEKGSRHACPTLGSVCSHPCSDHNKSPVYKLNNGIETPALALGEFDSELQKTSSRGEDGRQRYIPAHRHGCRFRHRFVVTIKQAMIRARHHT